MHRYKNRKLYSIIIAGLITYISFNNEIVYATSDVEHIIESEIEEEVISNEDDTSKIKEISVKEINDESNLGMKVSVKGYILRVENDKIYIKDDSGEGLIFLTNINIKNLKENDLISVIGIIEEKESVYFISISDVNDINLIESNQEEENPNLEEENLNHEEDKENKDDKNESSDNNQINKPNNMNNLSNNTTNISSQIDKNSSNTNKNQVTEQITVTGIKAKDPIIISYDLTDKQWDLIKENIESKNIKAKDLKNNTIRITKVNENSGDKIWIVTDPRNLYEEVNNTIGDEIADSLLYSEYNISESSWETIIEDVKSGNAKIKYDSEKNIKVIYNKSNSKDSISTIERKV